MSAKKCSDEALIRDYVELRLPMKVIVRKYGYTSHVPICHRLRRLGVPPRDHKLANVPLSPVHRQLIIGGLLGDASAISSHSGNVYIKFAQSIKQVAYVEWKHQMMQPFSRRLCTYSPSGYGYGSCEFVTATLPTFIEFREAFYPLGQKTVPDMVEELDALGLAVWLMDDGTIDRKWRRIYFCTCSFSDGDNRRLIDLLGSKFNLRSTLVWTTTAGKHYRRIALSAKSFDRFKSIVEPHIIPSLRYKINC